GVQLKPRLLLGLPRLVICNFLYNNRKPHGEVSSPADLSTRQFIVEIGITQFLPHLFRCLGGDEFELCRHAGHCVHLHPKVRQINTVQYVFGADHQKHLLAFWQMQFQRLEVVKRVLVRKIETKLIYAVDLSKIVLAEFAIGNTGIADRPRELLANDLDHFSLLAGRGSDSVPCAKPGKDENRKYDGRYDRPGQLKVVIVRVEFCLPAFPVLKLVGEDKHHNADDGEGHHRHSHRNPEKRIRPRAVLRSNRRAVAVKVGEGIPEKEAEADHHKHEEQKGIYAVARGNLFLILIPAGVLCQTYKAGQPEYQVKNSQQQQDTQTNNKSYHVYSRFLDMVMQTFFQHGMIPSDERHPGKRVEHNQEKGSQEN